MRPVHARGDSGARVSDQPKAFRDEPCSRCVGLRCGVAFGQLSSLLRLMFPCLECFDPEEQINTGRVIVAVTA